MTIRFAHEKDCVSLTALSIKVWLSAYAQTGISQEHADFVLNTFTIDYFTSLLRSDKHLLLVDEEGGILKGYLQANTSSCYNSDTAYGYEVEKLYVNDMHRGQGIASALLSKCMSHLGKQFWLFTWEESAANLFYQHIGLTQIGSLSFDFYGQDIHNHVYVS